MSIISRLLSKNQKDGKFKTKRKRYIKTRISKQPERQHCFGSDEKKFCNQK
jgi:hypothetical protein